MTEVVKAKVCIIGEASVGKTSLVRRFVHDEFDDRYVATLGAKVSKKELDVRTGDGEIRVLITLWDIMGEESFRELLKEPYFTNTRGIVAVADLTRPATVAALSAWIDAAQGVAGPVPLVLFGNKVDLRPTAGAEAALAEHAGSRDAPWYRTSAKTGENVESAFAGLAAAIVGGLRPHRPGP